MAGRGRAATLPAWMTHGAPMSYIEVTSVFLQPSADSQTLIVLFMAAPGMSSSSCWCDMVSPHPEQSLLASAAAQ